MATYQFTGSICGQKAIKATDLVDGVLDPLWKANKIVTAKNIQEMIKGVLALAIARNYGDLAGSDNAASVEEGQPLALLRPKISEVYTKTSHAAFPWQDIGQLVAALREYTWSHGVRWAYDISEPRKKYIVRFAQIQNARRSSEPTVRGSAIVKWPPALVSREQASAAISRDTWSQGR